MAASTYHVCLLPSAFSFTMFACATRGCRSRATPEAKRITAIEKSLNKVGGVDGAIQLLAEYNHLLGTDMAQPSVDLQGIVLGMQDKGNLHEISTLAPAPPLSSPPPPRRGKTPQVDIPGPKAAVGEGSPTVGLG